MRNLDILAAENGEHVRVLLCGEEQSYVVSCQHFRMPYPVASDLLAELQPVPAETYSVFVLDEDITNRQREGRNRKLDLIAPLLEDACIYDKSHRNEVVRQIAAEHGIARRTVLQYLWRYWVYQSKNALLPAERPAPEQHELTADEKAIRWALNKYYYTPQRQSLQTAYKMMLRAKYCDRDGSVYHAVLDSALRSRGWRSLTGGRTYATKIETALLNLYGSYIPTADLSTKQLHATLCSKSVALRYVLQLAVLLGLSLHDLLHAPDAVPDYKAEMKAMYQSGASMYHIAQLYGIDAKTVARWIKS